MMNLQIWWWAARETGDPHWRELGLKHALKSAAVAGARRWLRHPVGALQSGRQSAAVHVPAKRFSTIPTTRPPGRRSSRTRTRAMRPILPWARGTAWAVYGFAEAYRATDRPELLATAEKSGGLSRSTVCPQDGVPWYDFGDEGVHFRNRDTLGGGHPGWRSVAAGGDRKRRRRRSRYRRQAERIVQSLIDSYLTPYGIPEPRLHHAAQRRHGYLRGLLLVGIVASTRAG